MMARNRQMFYFARGWVICDRFSAASRVRKVQLNPSDFRQGIPLVCDIGGAVLQNWSS